MTNGLLLLVLMAGIGVPGVLFFRERHTIIEYLVFGAGMLAILVTLTILMLQHRSEPSPTTPGIDPDDAAALLLPTTSTVTRSAPAPTATPEVPTPSATPDALTPSATISVPTAPAAIAPTPDLPAPSPTEGVTPSAAPEAIVSTVQVGAAKIRREPAGTSPIVGYVARDDELVVIDFQNGWVLVRLGERHAPDSAVQGGQGWISGELIRVP